MAAESPEDKGVDALIADMQATLDKLKAAQRKDVTDEDSEESDESQPKNLKEAQQKAYKAVRSARDQADNTKSEK